MIVSIDLMDGLKSGESCYSPGLYNPSGSANFNLIDAQHNFFVAKNTIDKQIRIFPYSQYKFYDANPIVSGLCSGSDGVTNVNWAGGMGQLMAQGDWGGASGNLEFSIDGGNTWTLLQQQGTKSYLTGDGSFSFLSAATDSNYELRFNCTGTSVSTNFDFLIHSIDSN